MTPTSSQLRQFIEDHFSDEELDALCFDHFKDVRNSFSSSTSFSRKVMLLIEHCEHRGSLTKLCNIIAAERREAWNQKFPNLSVTTSAQIWTHYLNKVVEEHRDWHLPEELRDLIDWETSPVPIDEYIRLRPTSPPIASKPLLPSEVKPRIDHSKQNNLKLSEALQERLVLVLGAAGSGKSTCLRYLCQHCASHALQQIDEATAFQGTRIPILITLKHFGSVDLTSLILAHLRKRGLQTNRDKLEALLSSYPIFFLLDGYDEANAKWRGDLDSR